MYKLFKPEETEVLAVELNQFDHKYDFEVQELSAVPNGVQQRVSSYIISKDLITAINSALITNRPLLLKGEPGSGKTKVALAVATHFFGKEALKYYFEWHVKSKSKAKEGTYVFDHLGRLRDATIADKDPKAKKRIQDMSPYVKLGPMGKAFKATSTEASKPIVLLIDEIDKGDIDFPNDLLLELDEMRFKIDEMNLFIDADKSQKPLVIITSNDERDLPPAFLRRCLYYKIPSHDTKILSKIAQFKMEEFCNEMNVSKDKIIGSNVISQLVGEFEKEREKAGIAKKPSTSELLDWLKISIYKIGQGESFDSILNDQMLKSLTLTKES